MAELKDRLKIALDKKDWKAVDLCEKTGVPKSAVSYYLAGKSKPKQDRLYIIAKALDVTEAWLLGYDVPSERDEMQKKNDKLVELVAKLRRDSNFYNMVCKLSTLEESESMIIEQMLTALTKK